MQDIRIYIDFQYNEKFFLHLFKYIISHDCSPHFAFRTSDIILIENVSTHNEIKVKVGLCNWFLGFLLRFHLIGT